MFSNDRNSLRKLFFDVHARFKAGQTLQPLEQIILQVIQAHPEYHSLLDDPANLDRDYHVDAGQTNPFLHMSMHIAIAEQLGSQRPANINTIYQSLCQKYGDPHEAEHQMMECMGKMIWQAQRNNEMPDENRYLACLAQLLD